MSNLKTFKVTYGNIENKVERAYLKAYHYNEALRRAKRINGLSCIIKLEVVKWLVILFYGLKKFGKKPFVYMTMSHLVCTNHLTLVHMKNVKNAGGWNNDSKNELLYLLNK